ncbi:hypothetical protein KTR66_20205 [Roseococcus sp. SDR]|uniref:hypothetical protein n=1 Tax=Roseococcus sp. SDR TaxID=2835532 RepID=UPI001BCF7664|nr:hypothetical protein [Roseococcus sp. SDR]MBS7792326.1 hypothetical protein [Roseococcus sp. SDR]MBV1847640.1 hypothetical protein [Roseococcus sp. SDR]
MRIRILLLAAALLAAPPLARACDPEAMNAELTVLCRAGLDPAIAWSRAVLPLASAAEAAELERTATAAGDACDVGDPAAGALAAVQLARLVGRIEARGAAATLQPARLPN